MQPERPEAMPENLCVVKNMTIHAGGRLLLTDIDLKFSATGLYAVMGPVGVGKSTLLATLDGHGNSNGLSVSSDEMTYADNGLSLDNRPIVIEQASRSEQAQRAIDGGTIKSQIKDALAKDPAMLCLDEPTAGVAHNEALSMLEWLKAESKKRAIIMVTHNSEQARFFADWVVLLGGGRIVEQGPTEVFFDKPSNPVTKHFIKTGSLSLPRLDAHPRQLAPEHRGLPEGINTQTVGATDGLLNWIIRRSFAIAKSDIESSVDRTKLVAALKGRSIDMLAVCEKTAPRILQDMKAAGIDVLIYKSPYPDAQRDIRASLALANQINAVISSGRRVAVLETQTGQTEILAAVQLIHMGITAQDAVDLLNAKMAGIGIHAQDERFLWDLELVLDLSSDSDQPNFDSVDTLKADGNIDSPVQVIENKGATP